MKCTASDKTDYEDIVKDYNLKDCVIATVAAWQKVKTSTMNHAWNHLLKKIDTEASQVELKNYQDDIETIVDLSKVVGVKEFDINREMEDPTSDAENYPNSDHEEANNNSESDEENEKPKKNLMGKNLKDIKDHFEALIAIIKDNDDDDLRSQKTVTKLNKLTFSYRSDLQTRLHNKSRPKSVLSSKNPKKRKKGETVLFEDLVVPVIDLTTKQPPKVSS